MSDDYAKGFKDGFQIGLEEGKRNQNLNPVPSYLGSPGYCQVCGKNWGNGGVWGYVCNNQYCPSRAIAYSDGAVTGAVGATYDNMSVSHGANGPADWAGNPMSIQSDK